ncbi:SLAM family member 5-like [Acomys russatus]|uniref:SLAM family member 5-like n=1 Tax=Acomys russatus TaxID=60746 RepID=UPI0021E1E2F4|nr:SLAM family member 5-like [Acomys russatus]
MGFNHLLSEDEQCLRKFLRSESAGRGTESMVVNGTLGESVTFHVNIQEPQKVRNIAWASESSIAFIKPGVGGGAPEVVVSHFLYKGRIEVMGQHYNLVIRHLRMEDAGTYTVNINDEHSTVTKRYHLHIYRRLGKPTITQIFTTPVNNACNVILTCSVGNEEKNVVYSWSPSGEKGNILQIFHSPENQKMTYTCMAQNPVSNNSDSFTLPQSCADTRGSHVHPAVLPSGLAVLSLFILIAVLALLFHLYKRRQGRIALEAGDVSKDTIYSVVSRTAHHTESRINGEIPESDGNSRTEEMVNPIYSTVQLPEKM